MSIAASSSIAVLIAVIGAILAAAFGPMIVRRLSWLVGIAAAALLGITLFDIIPDARALLNGYELVLGLASGVLLFWAISRYIHPVCPACSGPCLLLPTRERLGKAAVLLTFAICVHCAADGLALAVGNHSGGGGRAAMSAGVFIHKFPEGIALATLLLGVGYVRKTAVLWTAAVESSTWIGGWIGAWSLQSASHLWIGLVFAHIGGAFLYIAGSTAAAYFRQPKISPALLDTSAR